MADLNNRNPDYYTRGSIEVWDFIRDQDLNYHLGCALKYICRAGHKDSKAIDLAKAIHYLQNELSHTVSDTHPVRSSGAIPDSLFSRDDWDYSASFTEEFDR